MGRLKVKLTITVTDRRGILIVERAMLEAFGLNLNAPENAQLKAEWKHKFQMTIGAYVDQYEHFREEIPANVSTWIKVNMEPMVSS